jgi:hypothetical protein
MELAVISHADEGTQRHEQHPQMLTVDANERPATLRYPLAAPKRPFGRTPRRSVRNGVAVGVSNSHLWRRPAEKDFMVLEPVTAGTTGIVHGRQIAGSALDCSIGLSSTRTSRWPSCPR